VAQQRFEKYRVSKILPGAAVSGREAVDRAGEGAARGNCSPATDRGPGFNPRKIFEITDAYIGLYRRSSI
jgi:hypothetical protein